MEGVPAATAAAVRADALGDVAAAQDAATGVAVLRQVAAGIAGRGHGRVLGQLEQAVDHRRGAVHRDPLVAQGLDGGIDVVDVQLRARSRISELTKFSWLEVAVVLMGISLRYIDDEQQRQ